MARQWSLFVADSIKIYYKESLEGIKIDVKGIHRNNFKNNNQIFGATNETDVHL